jgi:hypothetical protein
MRDNNPMPMVWWPWRENVYELWAPSGYLQMLTDLAAIISARHASVL